MRRVRSSILPDKPYSLSCQATSLTKCTSRAKSAIPSLFLSKKFFSIRENIVLCNHCHTNMSITLIFALYHIYCSRYKSHGPFCTSSNICRTTHNVREKSARIGSPQTTLDDIPANFLRHYPQYKKGAFNLTELARLCDISRTTAYKYIGLLEQ